MPVKAKARPQAALHDAEIQIDGVKFGIDFLHGGIGQPRFGHEYLVVKQVTRALDTTCLGGVNA